MSEPGRKRVKLLLQALVSAGLVAFVVAQIDLGQAKSLALRPQGLPWLLGALLLFNLSKIASALRLNVYQRHAAILLGELENLRLYYAGMFLNLFLPGGIGGDGYKILVLHRRQAVPISTLLRTTLTDRVSGLLILLLILCAMLPLLDLPFPAKVVYVLAAGGAVSILAAMVLGHYRLLGMAGKPVAVVFAYGVAVQALQLLCMAALLAYLNVPLGHFLPYLAVFLVSSVAAVLPLSFGGLGVREITFLYGMQLLQLDPAHGVVASTVFFLITVVSSLPGTLFVGGFSVKSQVAG